MEKKHSLSSKGWLWLFVGTVFLLAVLVAGFNICTDPFGTFGDPIMGWWEYNETMNPRVAKLSYLEQNHSQYDSYIIGPSSTSSFPTEALNQYFDASFYNMTMYGADMLDVEQMGLYVLEHYEVKNLVVSLYIHCAEIYDTEPNPLTYGMPCQADGSNPIAYYGKYLFASPKYGIEKIKAWNSDPYLQQPYRVFNEQTGAYDKSRRDAEPIGDLEDYLSRSTYSVFRNYPTGTGSIQYLQQCMDRLTRLRDACEEKGVHFTVVCPPMYGQYLNHFSQEDQAAFYNALAEVTDYWDFSLSAASFEPRFFYDETHFRNDLGTMCLARMFDDPDVYIPQGLGRHVTKGSTPGAPQATPVDESTYTTQVPVLLYHHLAETGEGSDIISQERFLSHMTALKENGYNTVFFDELQDYVQSGTPLPEKPVVITFDDGYESNYTLAYPILKEYNMKATIFAIGVSVGKDTYKDTNQPMNPHFSLEQAAEMEASGLIDIQSHGYNMHEVIGRDQEPVRRGLLQKEGESEEDYLEYLQKDFEQVTQAIGKVPSVFAYPYGATAELPAVVLHQQGIYATVTTVEKTNTLVQGLNQSLLEMGRFYMTEAVTAEELLALLNSQS